jgi:hypothetical protein
MVRRAGASKTSDPAASSVNSGRGEGGSATDGGDAATRSGFALPKGLEIVLPCFRIRWHRISRNTSTRFRGSSGRILQLAADGSSCRKRWQEIAWCSSRVAMAVGVSGLPSIRGWNHRSTPPPSSARNGRAAGVQGCGAHKRDIQTRDLSHASPFFCHASAGEWVRPSDSPGVAGPQGCADDDDLHSCSEPRRTRGSQSHRHALGV